MKVDLGRKLYFPESVLSLPLRRHHYVVARGDKVNLVELTVPWEEACEDVAEKKREIPATCPRLLG